MAIGIGAVVALYSFCLTLRSPTPPRNNKHHNRKIHRSKSYLPPVAFASRAQPLSSRAHCSSLTMAARSSTTDDVSQTQQPRSPTLRTLDPDPPVLDAATARTQLRERTTSMTQRAKDGAIWTRDEVEGMVQSLEYLWPVQDSDTTTSTTLDRDALKRLLTEVAHLSHKDWSVTGANAARLGAILLPNGTIDATARQVLERILTEGNWDGAAAAKRSSQPWAVLVTGVNGIRKTTSIYQPWFPSLLQEALVAPQTTDTTNVDFDVTDLPCGSNSFFRQLDHMMATLCNREFSTLYRLTRDSMGNTDEDDDDNSNVKEPSADVVQHYSDLKAAIFTRYRTVSELLGALLLTQAQPLRSNCLLETSGRDVAMFHYVDHFFPDDTNYHKLALHFTVNDLTQAKTSVDRRMAHEIGAGVQALTQRDVWASVRANEGGPYGSSVLEGVQADSDRVWKDQVMGSGAVVGQDWYKATIQINANESEPWTAQAVRPDGSLGTVFAFPAKK